jgi:hypothetical protein
VASVKSSERAHLYLVKIRKITLVDTQAIRAKSFRQLDGLFEWSISIAKGR